MSSSCLLAFGNALQKYSQLGFLQKATKANMDTAKAHRMSQIPKHSLIFGQMRLLPCTATLEKL